MRNRTFLVSAFIAFCIHALLLLVNLGMTPPTLASTASAIEVTLVAPPQSASLSPATPPAPAPVIKPEQIEISEPEIKPESPPEAVPLPEPEPIVEPEPLEPKTAEQPGDVEMAREIPVFNEEPVAGTFDENASADDSSRATHELAGDETESIGQSEYFGDTVDQMPSYAHNPKPAYPWTSRRRGQQGTVLLMAEVLPTGRVGRVSVERSSGHELLDNAAVRAVREWRFVPARRGKTVVKSWVKIPVEFDLREER